MNTFIHIVSSKTFISRFVIILLQIYQNKIVDLILKLFKPKGSQKCVFGGVLELMNEM